MNMNAYRQMVNQPVTADLHVKTILFPEEGTVHGYAIFSGVDNQGKSIRCTGCFPGLSVGVPVRVNGNSGNPGNSAPQTVTTNSRTVNGSSPAQGGGTVTYSKAHDVKTGDETHAEFWILLAVVAVTAGGAVLVRRKKT